MAENTVPNEAQFKGLGFHHTLALMVDYMIAEFTLYHSSSGHRFQWMFSLYHTIKHTFPFIETQEGQSAAKRFGKKWEELNNKEGTRFEREGGMGSKSEVIERFDAIMEYMTSSGLIKPGVKEENWEDDFVNEVEEKMEREA